MIQMLLHDLWPLTSWVKIILSQLYYSRMIINKYIVSEAALQSPLELLKYRSKTLTMETEFNSKKIPLKNRYKVSALSWGSFFTCRYIAKVSQKHSFHIDTSADVKYGVT